MDDDINFTYEDNTGISNSCAASLNDQMWVFGGTTQNQVNFKYPDNSADIICAYVDTCVISNSRIAYVQKIEFW